MCVKYHVLDKVIWGQGHKVHYTDIISESVEFKEHIYKH